jgi:hypothetical protein
MPINKGIVLASRPAPLSKATPENFRLVESASPEPGPGQVLVRNTYLSLDPYMRGRMEETKSYVASQPLLEVMGGGTVGEVVASNNPSFKPGDKIVGMGGWQLYSLDDGQALRKIEPGKIPIQAWLGPLGMPGVTAWAGVKRIIAPKAGETLVVSAATGAVGSVVGQLAKAAGARAVGIAGGPEKCAYAVKELGFDACVDHRAENFDALLAGALPRGIDGLVFASFQRFRPRRPLRADRVLRGQGAVELAGPQSDSGQAPEDPGVHRLRRHVALAAGHDGAWRFDRRGQAALAGKRRGRN